MYGTEVVVAPLPEVEQVLNPKYAGCLNHGARAAPTVHSVECRHCGDYHPRSNLCVTRMPIPILTRVRRGLPRSLRFALPFGLPLALSCGADHLNPPGLTDPTVLFWDLALTQRASTG